MTLAGSVHVKPVGVETEAASMTVPVKPLTTVTVIVEVPEAGETIGFGLTAPAEIVKSTTWNRIVPVEWLSVPSVPVTVTV